MSSPTMSDETARAVLDAYRRSGIADTESAAHVIGAWLQADGWEKHPRYGDYRKGSQRMRFRARVVQLQQQRNGSWYNLRSTPLLLQASELVLDAALIAKDDVATAAILRASSRKEKAKQQRKKANEDQERRQEAERARIEQLWRARTPGLIEYLSGEVLTPEQRASLQAARESTVPRAMSFSAEEPPILPLFLANTVSWVETEGGVRYSVVVQGEGGPGKYARIYIGQDNTGLRVDPVTRTISVDGFNEEGDGSLSAKIGWSTKLKRPVAKVFLIVATTKRSGAGRRMMRIFLRLLRAYNVPRFIAEAVGPEGLAFLQALERSGEIKLGGTDGRDHLVELGAPQMPSQIL